LKGQFLPRHSIITSLDFSSKAFMHRQYLVAAEAVEDPFFFVAFALVEDAFLLVETTFGTVTAFNEGVSVTTSVAVEKVGSSSINRLWKKIEFKFCSLMDRHNKNIRFLQISRFRIQPYI
jgi:hypothetical protein